VVFFSFSITQPNMFVMKKIIALLIVCAGLSFPAHAQTPLFTTTFTGTDGTTPTGFTVVTGNTTQIRILNNDYQANNGTFTNLLSVVSSGTAFQNYAVSTNFSIGGYASGGYAGVVANYTNSSNFYQARMFATATSNTWQLQIYKTVAGATSLIASSSTFAYTASETWSLSFTANSGLLSANLYNTSGSIVASLLNQADSSLTSGTAGIRTTPPGSNAVIYSDFTVTAIPEPSTVAMLSGAIVLVGTLCVRRRQRQN
jgi:hypothetical protein